jgi:hypothetical protein
MIEKKTQTLANLQGQGVLVRGQIEIGPVRYKLMVTQEILYVQTGGGLDVVPGLKKGAGEFHSLSGQLPLESGDQLTLRPEKGQEISVQVVSSFWGETGTFQLTPASFDLFGS